MARKITPFVVDKLKQWEGVKLLAYLDSVGVWTIGYGHTGSDVRPGLRITQERAEELLRQDLGKFEAAVDRAVKVQLTDNQFGTLVSFAFIVGVGAFQKSTLLRRLNAGDYNAVPAELMKWTKGTINRKKVTIPGLVNRRSAEAGLWATGAYVSSAPVQAGVGKPIYLTGEGIAVAGSVASSVATAAAGPGPLQWAFAVILVLAAVAAGFYFFRRFRDAAA